MLSRVILAVSLTLLALPAQAQVVNGVSLTTMLRNVVNFLTGQTGQILAILAVAFVGILMMFNAMERGTGGRVIVGVIILFGSAWIVNMILTGSVA